MFCFLLLPLFALFKCTPRRTAVCVCVCLCVKSLSVYLSICLSVYLSPLHLPPCTCLRCTRTTTLAQASMYTHPHAMKHHRQLWYVCVCIFAYGPFPPPLLPHFVLLLQHFRTVQPPFVAVSSLELSSLCHVVVVFTLLQRFVCLRAVRA